MTNHPHTSPDSSPTPVDSSSSPTLRDTVTSFERYSDDIRHAMRIANREAKWHGHPEIGVLRLLIALVREPTGLGGAILRLKGLDARRVRRAVRACCPRRWIFSLFAKLPLSSDLHAVVYKASEHAIVEKHDAVG